MTRIVSEKQAQFNQLVSLVKAMTGGPEEKLVRFCYSKGFTFQEIADALGISKQALNNKYPDLFKHRREQRDSS